MFREKPGRPARENPKETRRQAASAPFNYSRAVCAGSADSGIFLFVSLK
jgi:hypothetical protein